MFFEQKYFPTFLTLTRLIVSTFIFPFIVVYLLPYNVWWLNGIVATVFVALCLTDFFDGYYARMYGKETDIGQTLDPIADKFLVYATLISLLAIHKIYFYWVILLIGREIFMMGLRIVALERHLLVTVSCFGKMKTVVQMLLLSFLMVNPYQGVPFKQAPIAHKIEWALLAITIMISFFSAAVYIHTCVSQLLFQRRKRVVNHSKTEEGE